MSKLSADNLSNQADTKEIPVETVVAGSAKAWVYFNGTGTIAIFDSFNVSSITDNGPGDTQINFTNNMASVNYAIAGSCASSLFLEAASRAVGSMQVRSRTDAGTLTDNIGVSALVLAN